jgi:hypothetical protein
LPSNQKSEAYPDELLITKLIALARELGHLPVSGDLRMKARQDPDFPSGSVFSRLGPKSERVARVAEYCHGHAAFSDVLPLCETVADTDQMPTDEDSSGTESIGFVYLLKSGRFYKIGRSNACGRRERELAIQLPETAKIVHEIRTDDPVGIELTGIRGSNRGVRMVNGLNLVQQRLRPSGDGDSCDLSSALYRCKHRGT